MPKPSPRNPFQIHLSTAIVLMFVAGGIIWLNVTPHTRNWYFYGWPAISYVQVHASDIFEMNRIAREADAGSMMNYYINPGWHVSSVVVDLLVAMLIVIGVGFAIEVWHDWRELRRDT